MYECEADIQFHITEGVQSSIKRTDVRKAREKQLYCRRMDTFESSQLLGTTLIIWYHEEITSKSWDWWQLEMACTIRFFPRFSLIHFHRQAREGSLFRYADKSRDELASFSLDSEDGFQARETIIPKQWSPPGVFVFWTLCSGQNRFSLQGQLLRLAKCDAVGMEDQTGKDTKGGY